MLDAIRDGNMLHAGKQEHVRGKQEHVEASRDMLQANRNMLEASRDMLEASRNMLQASRNMLVTSSNMLEASRNMLVTSRNMLEASRNMSQEIQVPAKNSTYRGMLNTLKPNRKKGRKPEIRNAITHSSTCGCEVKSQLSSSL